MKMKILLIKPPWFSNSNRRAVRYLKSAPLGLGILAALSSSHDVTIIDNDVQEIPYYYNWDLVGITVTTFTAMDAYSIADRFRTMGVKVVLGGVHPSLLPDEALEHADAVVIGEAERQWPLLLSDFPDISPVYEEKEQVDMDRVPLPRRDLFHNRYRIDSIQITRGCNHGCEYCYLRSIPGAKYRRRDPASVEREFAQMSRRFVFIVDDNFFIDRDYVLEISRRISPFKKFWFCQAPLSFGLDVDLVKQCADSGLCLVTFGIDSVIQESLDSSGKSHCRVDECAEAVSNLHAHGIAVSALMVIGFDHDTREVFERTISFLKETNIDSALFFILTPYPGTDLFRRYEKEGRILVRDWSRYNWIRAVFEPEHMTAEELEKNTGLLYQSMFRMRLRNLHRTLPLALRMSMRSPRLPGILAGYY